MVCVLLTLMSWGDRAFKSVIIIHIWVKPSRRVGGVFGHRCRGSTYTPPYRFMQLLSCGVWYIGLHSWRVACMLCDAQERLLSFLLRLLAGHVIGVLSSRGLQLVLARTGRLCLANHLWVVCVFGEPPVSGMCVCVWRPPWVEYVL